jgi:hypothetical protein
MSRTRERKRIAKDPFHQQILEALGRHLDAQVFEACIADLLRDEFPGLVPVPGGDDAGMDGAIADGKGEPYPLVCTTGEDVARNLRDSLDAFLDRGLSSRKVGFATSRTLTPPETRELFRLAQEKGFKLLQVFERSALADLLYHKTVWCKRLLGLSGTPSALSVVPLSRRPQIDIELKGREEDAEWLRNTPGDRVVLGLPGSGKTYLFSSLIRSDWPALFLVSDDDTAIANAARDQKPGIVIVDDAHVSPDRLVRLRRLRDEIQGEFEIVASSWPGASADVIEAIGGLPESRIHNLGLLPRAQILEIYHDLDVRPRDEILRDLVSQAGNKPGLAVTIALLWRQGEWQKILDGTVLSRTLLALFKGLTGGEIADVLAAFSLGGRRGMGLEAVAGFLEIPSRAVRKIAADLAAGGVLSEVNAERLAVNPQVLRSALLRQIFFTGSPIRLDYRKLLPSAPSFAESVGEIMAARAYGAVVPMEDLHGLVLQSGSRQAWSTLAVVSEEDARWVLENYPDGLLNVASDLLHLIPRMVIPRIFRTAEMTRLREPRPDGLMNVLSSWVQELEVPAEEWTRRRRMVAQAAKIFLLDGGDRGIAIQGICIGLNPTVQGSSQDPGLGTIITMRSGLLPVESLQELESIWEETQDAVQEIDAASWRHLSSLLWDWLNPEYASRGASVAEDTRRIMRGFVSRIVRDLALRTGNSPGLRAGMERLASGSGLRLELDVDPVFELLYPKPGVDPRSRVEEEAAQIKAINALAVEWAKESPREVAKRIAFYEQEALRAAQDWLQNMQALCQSLAESVDAPENWLDPLLREGLRRHLISPFLQRAVELRREGWEDWLAFYLDREPLVWTAISVILQLPDPPPQLLSHALLKAVEDMMLVEILCLQKRVPLSTLRLLLGLPSWETALAAAVGEWCADQQGEVREEVRPEWQAAILRAKTGETVGFQYWLGIILTSNADLAFDWLQSRLKDSDLPWSFMGDSPFSRAASALRETQRKKLLEELKPASLLQSLIPALIRRDEELFRRLLDIPSLADYHLEPLGGPQAPGWESFARAALDAGYDPEAIARAALGTSYSWAGSGLEYWEQWDQAFAAFENHPREDLREVVRIGRKYVQDEIAKARKLQRQFELYGVGKEG